MSIKILITRYRRTANEFPQVFTSLPPSFTLIYIFYLHRFELCQTEIGEIFKDINYLHFPRAHILPLTFRFLRYFTSLLHFSEETPVYANTRRRENFCSIALSPALRRAASFSRIYQTLLTMYWHCNVIDLPIYPGTEKWFKCRLFSKERGIFLSFIKQTRDLIARPCKDRNEDGAEFKETWEKDGMGDIQFTSCSGLAGATNSTREKGDWIQSRHFSDD